MKRVLVFLMTLCMLMGLCSVNVWAEEEVGWREETPMPTGKTNITVSTVGNKIYAIGGRGECNVEIYDAETGTWEIGADLPITGENCIYIKSTSVGEKIYVFTADNYGTSQSMLIYDTKSNTWTIEDYKIDGYVFTAVSIGKNIYALHYDNQDRLVHLDILDTKTGVWTQGSHARIRAINTEAVIVGNKIYVPGGSKNGPADDCLQIYDIETDTWSTGASMLKERKSLSTVAWGTKIYAIGGYREKSVEVYDTITDKWTKGVPLLVERDYADSAIVNGKIYLIGGSNSDEKTPRSMESFQIADSSIAKKLFVLLNVGETVQLSITNNLADNSNLTWTSSNEAIATVDGNGKVTAVAEGNTDIYAQNDDGSFKEYIPVKVVKGSADKTRLATYLKAGEKVRLYLSDDPSLVKWSSMDESVATVSESGQVTGVQYGLAIIQGEIDGQTYQFYVRVVNS